MTEEMRDCAACRRSIDALAKLCPYCGADPFTGEKFDPKPVIESHFPPRAELTKSESILEFFRKRQPLVVFAVIVTLFLFGTALHMFITQRNATRVNDVPAIPLSEIADISARREQTPTVPMPALEFQHDGSARRMKTYLVEPGATPPPPEVQARIDTARGKRAGSGSGQQTTGATPAISTQPSGNQPGNSTAGPGALGPGPDTSLNPARAPQPTPPPQTQPLPPATNTDD